MQDKAGEALRGEFASVFCIHIERLETGDEAWAVRARRKKKKEECASKCYSNSNLASSSDGAVSEGPCHRETAGWHKRRKLLKEALFFCCSPQNNRELFIPASNPSIYFPLA